MHLGRKYKLTELVDDFPISSIARPIEIEMRTMLGETTGLKPIETKQNVLF